MNDPEKLLIPSFLYVLIINWPVASEITEKIQVTHYHLNRQIFYGNIVIFCKIQSCTVTVCIFTFDKKSGFVRVMLKANFNSTYGPNP